MIGKTLYNRYEILEHLGDGSTATVYKAVDSRLGRLVALKILLPHVRSTTRSRFFQEAHAAAQLNHPNIMAIFDMVEDHDQPFLVVEYVEGVPLSDYIPSPVETVINLGYQMAMALYYAHERQIIHRDIKPANIHVTPEMQVKIMDLGLALPREATRVTAEGMIIGTPAYLSPEQAQGHKLDPRTDIYSLGIVLYEMISGQLPFDADEISALLLQQVKQPAPPPRLIVPDIPPALEQVILKALEKQPAMRFQSCRVMGEALLDSMTASTTPESPTQARRPTGLPTIPQAAAVDRSIRIILADDHRVLRKALMSELEARPEFVVVGEAGDGEAALLKTVALLPDVLLLDLNMPGKGGLDVLPEIRTQAPSVKVLVLTGREESGYIVRALRAGANGYILKSSDENELIDAIIKVHEGQLVLGRGVTEKVVTGLLKDQSSEADNEISETERRVLLYVARGYDNEAIGQRMELSMPTVIETLASAMDKLDASDRNEAALLALRDGYILLDEVHTIP